MEIRHAAMAGTMESSDAMVMVDRGNGGIQLSITSPVIHQFGEQIRKVVMETLEALEVTDVKINIVDKGALDCTIKARVEGAVFRAADASQSNIPWGGAVR